MSLKRSFLFILVSCAFLFTTGCAKDLISGKDTYNWYKVDDDVKLGNYVMKTQLKELKDRGKEVDSPKDAKELQLIKNIVKRIGAVSHYPNFPWEVHIADVPVVNAWCAPGGKIMVYEGLWDKEKGLVDKNNADQLAAVLAHEIAHATARHVTETISTNMTIMMAGQVAASAISAASPTGGNIFSQVFANGMNIYLPSYSSSNELEADRVGLLYMAKAGYDPREAVNLWKKAASEKKTPTTIFASHPSSGSRAKQLEKYLPEAMAIYEEVGPAPDSTAGRQKKRK